MPETDQSHESRERTVHMRMRTNVGDGLRLREGSGTAGDREQVLLRIWRQRVETAPWTARVV